MNDHEAPPSGDSPARPGWRIALVGGGVGEVDLDELCARIRRREVDGTTEVCRPGTDTWIRATEATELASWLRLSAGASTTTVRPQPFRSTDSVLARALAGARYPLTGSGLVVLAALAIASLMPIVHYAVGPATALWVLAIIRDTAKGNRSMSMDVASGLEDLVEVAWKVALVSLVTLLPVIAVMGWEIHGHGVSVLTEPSFRLKLALAVAVSLLYYPASLATVAVWDHAMPAVDPVHVFRVIRAMGQDYFVAVLVGTLGVCAGAFISYLLSTALSAVPLVGTVPGFLVSTTATFWAAHVLGWAVHRHLTDLGWN
jgi:hypothetical protein